MPARIHVSQGVLKGTVFEIQKNFIRVGSDLSSDICLPSPDIPGSTFILEFDIREKEYRVFCRSDDTTYYNGRLIAEGTKFVWKPGLSLSIANHAVLELETDPDPTPIPMESNREKRIRDFAFDYESQTQGQTQANRQSAKNATAKKGTDVAQLIKLLVTIACIAAIPILFLVKNNMGDSEKPKTVLTYSELEEKVMDACESGELPRLYMQRLITANRLESVSLEKSLEEYHHLRDLLLSYQKNDDDVDSGSDDIVEIKKNLWNFTVHRIQLLNNRKKSNPSDL